VLGLVFYQTAAGRCPVQDYLEGQTDVDRALILANVQAFREEFPSLVTVSVKPLRGKIWEVRVAGAGAQHRLLYFISERPRRPPRFHKEESEDSSPRAPASGTAFQGDDHMKKKILERREVRLTGRKARRVDLHAWIRKERKRSRAFREAFDEARQATEIARELARIRRDEGVSQAEIARRLKTSQQAISRMEQPDYAGYSIRTLVRYAESLGRELRFFVSEPEEPYGSRRKSKR